MYSEHLWGVGTFKTGVLSTGCWWELDHVDAYTIKWNVIQFRQAFSAASVSDVRECPIRITLRIHSSCTREVDTWLARLRRTTTDKTDYHQNHAHVTSRHLTA